MADMLFIALLDFFPGEDSIVAYILCNILAYTYQSWLCRRVIRSGAHGRSISSHIPRQQTSIAPASTTNAPDTVLPREESLGVYGEHRFLNMYIYTADLVQTSHFIPSASLGLTFYLFESIPLPTT